MTKTLERILMTVQKPARYVAGRGCDGRETFFYGLHA